MAARSDPGGPGWSRRGGPAAVAGTAADLDGARRALLSPPPGARRLDPASLREVLVELYDFWLVRRAAAIGIADGAALVATGALGRRELVPWSRPRLLLVRDGTRSGPDAGEAGRVAASLWAPLRDTAAGADTAVATVGEAVASSLRDLDAALGLLDARLIAGDPATAERLAATAHQAWRAGIGDRFDHVVGATCARWARAGEAAVQIAPDLREGRGGLRDLRLLDALVTARWVDRPAVDVEPARALLLDLRTELHRRSGRPRDVLDADDAQALADVPELRFADRVALARSLSAASRTVAHALDVALRPAVPTARRWAARRPRAAGIVEDGGAVALARGARIGRDPGLVLRLAAAAATTGRPLAVASVRRLAEAAPELRAPWPESARAELLALLGAGGTMVEVIDTLDRGGLWGRLFPEWSAVRDLPPGDHRHAWTVDRHLLEVTRHAAELTARVPRPDLLLIGALVHDLGRGGGGDHTARSAVLARRIGLRVGLPDADAETLARMVRHHRLLPLTALRHDPEDPATARSVVRTLGADPELVELVAALAEADARGTGPRAWSPWRAALVDDLVGRCRALLGGGPGTVEPGVR
ncbi:HD domain-containing protein [Actinomycetospora chlora]|uniref:HD domain-containing protein n=1 Tax=Actinomycetospora chlora TaxID=663608 RepID=UPI0031E8C16E